MFLKRSVSWVTMGSIVARKTVRSKTTRLAYAVPVPVSSVAPFETEQGLLHVLRWGSFLSLDIATFISSLASCLVRDCPICGPAAEEGSASLSGRQIQDKGVDRQGEYPAHDDRTGRAAGRLRRSRRGIARAKLLCVDVIQILSPLGQRPNSARDSAALFANRSFCANSTVSLDGC